MPHDHSHSHHDGHPAHAPQLALRPSLLRASAWQRLAGAAGLLGLLWLAVRWAIA